MRALLIGLAAVAISGCAGFREMNKYETNRSPDQKVYVGSDCFNVWKNPSGEKSIFVRQCEGKKFVQDMGEGVILGASLGIIRPDFGSTQAKFVEAATRYLPNNCKQSTTQKLDDGLSGTLGLQIFYECSDVTANRQIEAPVAAPKPVQQLQAVNPTAASQSISDVADKLERLKKLHSDGLITKPEYDAKRAQLLEAF